MPFLRLPIFRWPKCPKLDRAIGCPCCSALEPCFVKDTILLGSLLLCELRFCSICVSWVLLGFPFPLPPQQGISTSLPNSHQKSRSFRGVVPFTWFFFGVFPLAPAVSFPLLRKAGGPGGGGAAGRRRGGRGLRRHAGHRLSALRRSEASAGSGAVSPPLFPQADVLYQQMSLTFSP